MTALHAQQHNSFRTDRIVLLQFLERLEGLGVGARLRGIDAGDRLTRLVHRRDHGPVLGDLRVLGGRRLVARAPTRRASLFARRTDRDLSTEIPRGRSENVVGSVVD